MQIIPVIDILSGSAVAAYRGERDGYAPLRSPLCADASPGGVLAGYLELFPFQAVYLADLDAILELGDNHAVIEDLARQHPALQFWLDAGRRGGARNTPANVHAVLGSETGLAPHDLADAAGGDPGAVLSLDFHQAGLLGDPALLEQPRAWPRRCIAMALHRVGSGAGPDADLLAALRQRAPDRDWYAAGGIRHAADLETLAAAGAAGALVATALHRGAITRADLEDLEKSRISQRRQDAKKR